MNSGFAVFCGLDLNKGKHHTTGLTTDGTRVHDAALPTPKLDYMRHSTNLPNTGKF